MRCLRPLTVKNPVTGRYILVPCRKCPACLHNRQKEWAYRLMIEAKYSKNSSFFITVTFDDNKILDNPLLSQELDRNLFHLFIKRLQRRLQYHNIMKDVRYFGCGEYGNFGRAHYHFILFDVPLTSPELLTLVEDVWKYGFCTVSPLSDARCMYVAKYTCKELFEDRLYSDKKNKPFASFTRRSTGKKTDSDYLGSLGYSLLKDKKLVKRIKEEQMFYLTSENGSTFNIPRIYSRHIFSSYERQIHSDFLQSNDVLEMAVGKPSYKDLCISQIKQNQNYEQLFYKRLSEKRNLKLGVQPSSLSQADDSVS